MKDFDDLAKIRDTTERNEAQEGKEKSLYEG